MPGSQTGVTLVELLTVICLAGLVLAMAVPSYARLSTQARFAELSQGLISTLDYARSEAIRTNQPVHACALNAKSNLDIQGCRAKQLKQEFIWDEGLLIYADSPDNPNRRYDSREAIRHILFRSGIEVRANRHQITFDEEGRLESRLAQTFRLNDPSSHSCRTIRVTLSGKASACSPREAGCDVC